VNVYRDVVSLPDRAQSETIGIVLLTAVIVVVTTTAGFYILTDVNERTADNSRADLNITANETSVTIEHQGGDSFNASAISVIVRTGGEENQSILPESFYPVDGNDDRFAPGQRWKQNGSRNYSGEVEVLVVDTEGSQVLEQKTVDVTT